MTFSEENVILVLVSSLTAVLSFMFIRRAFWKDEETKEAAEWLSKESDKNITKEDVKETSDYIGQSAVILGILAALFWAILIYLLNDLKK